MDSGTSWSIIADRISTVRGKPFHMKRRRPVAGGCINSASVLDSDDDRYFVKLNHAACLRMFEAEAEGLKELAKTRAVRIPEPLCSGTSGTSAYLVLEYLDLIPISSHVENQKKFGRGLATLHRITAANFGWRLDDYVGATPQINTRGADWIEFWGAHRLGFQLSLARRNGYGGALQRKGERLRDELRHFFSGYAPAAALLHGDLWSGNYGVTADGEPALFDPAVYYGDREADIAMTELFGGFGSSFYGSYEDDYPLDPGYAVRKHLYNLYHVLNHLNLFGGGYGKQAERLMDFLLSQLR